MPSLIDRVRAAQIHAGEQEVLADLQRRGLAVKPVDTAPKRDDVHEMLRQLEPHAPQWVPAIRAYILKLERRSR